MIKMSQHVSLELYNKITNIALFNATMESQYEQAGRYHHTSRHIIDMLAEFGQNYHMASNPITLELAILYHDIIYNVPKYLEGENMERASAAFAIQSIPKIVPSITADALEEIELLICSTAETDIDRLAVYYPKDAVLLHDLDYSIMSTPEQSVYSAYAQNIANEYIPYVGEHKFYTERLKFLKLCSYKAYYNRLYATEHYQLHRSVRAYDNIEREIMYMPNIHITDSMKEKGEF